MDIFCIFMKKKIKMHFHHIVLSPLPPPNALSSHSMDFCWSMRVLYSAHIYPCPEEEEE